MEQTQEYRNAVQMKRDAWVPAHGGNEQPMVDRQRRTVLYCFNPAQHRHAYIDCGTDTEMHAGYDPCDVGGFTQ